jgi:hypothetical protein
MVTTALAWPSRTLTACTGTPLRCMTVACVYLRSRSLITGRSGAPGGSAPARVP